MQAGKKDTAASHPQASVPMLVIPSRSALRREPLQTRRLRLSPVERNDGADLWEAVEESRWHLERWLPWVPFNNTPQASQTFAQACAAEWDAGRALRFTIRDKQSGQMLGIVGLDNCVHLHRSCHLGYWLRRDATGRGMMHEAASEAARFAFERVKAHRMHCAAATDNFPSLRVISRLGFRFEGISREAEFVGGRWVDHAVFSRLETDNV